MKLKDFIYSYGLTWDEFKNLDVNAQNELRKAHEQKNREEQMRRQKDDSEYWDAMYTLAECGVPFGPDGTPLGIGWDD